MVSLTSHHSSGLQRWEDGHPEEWVTCGNRGTDAQPLTPAPTARHSAGGVGSFCTPQMLPPKPVDSAWSGLPACPAPTLGQQRHWPTRQLSPRPSGPLSHRPGHRGGQRLCPPGLEGLLHPESQQCQNLHPRLETVPRELRAGQASSQGALGGGAPRHPPLPARRGPPCGGHRDPPEGPPASPTSR